MTREQAEAFVVALWGEHNGEGARVPNNPAAQLIYSAVFGGPPPGSDEHVRRYGWGDTTIDAAKSFRMLADVLHPIADAQGVAP